MKSRQKSYVHPYDTKNTTYSDLPLHTLLYFPTIKTNTYLYNFEKKKVHNIRQHLFERT